MRETLYSKINRAFLRFTLNKPERVVPSYFQTSLHLLDASTVAKSCAHLNYSSIEVFKNGNIGLPSRGLVWKTTKVPSGKIYMLHDSIAPITAGVSDHV